MVSGGALAVFVLAREIVRVAGVIQHRLSSGAPIEVLGGAATQWISRLGVDPSVVLAAVRDGLTWLSSGAAAAAGPSSWRRPAPCSLS